VGSNPTLPSNKKLMNSELLNFIKTLSENDTKNLCQKTLKTTEEVGELAKAVLPFENAAGTLHRFSDRSKILDNVADVMLSAISIAYDLKFSNEEIERAMVDKSEKWHGIQVKEKGIKFPLPFEIHVTIERPDDIEKFKSFCKSIGVKPIVIDLEKNDQVVMQDVMTSSVHFGDNRSAYNEAERITKALRDGFTAEFNGVAHSVYKYQFKVLRTKIETVPWHPAAPSLYDDNRAPEGSYFESHLRIVAKPADRELLAKVAYHNHAHLSRNFFKKLNDEQYILMMTLRSEHDTREEFEDRVKALKKDLTDLKFDVDKTEIEFAIYDTKTSHDKAWIG
jgi:NTP pyrophosphatase (non-canonical NTP hydrolase)